VRGSKLASESINSPSAAFVQAIQLVKRVINGKQDFCALLNSFMYCNVYSKLLPSTARPLIKMQKQVV